MVSFSRLPANASIFRSSHLALTRSRRGFASLSKSGTSVFAPLDTFPSRHIGPNPEEAGHMLNALGYQSVDAFIADAVPKHIRIDSEVVSEASIPALSESELLRKAKELGRQNKLFRSYIGMGYHNAVVPPVILRNVRLIYSSLVISVLTTKIYR
jgi:glycine dehydrogenase